MDYSPPAFHENVGSLEDFWSPCSLFCFLSFGCVIIGGVGGWGEGKRTRVVGSFITRALNSYKEELKKKSYFQLVRRLSHHQDFYKIL